MALFFALLCPQEQSGAEIFSIGDLKSEEKKRDMFKNWPLIENPQDLSNPHETLSKCLLHEVIIFTKFHEDRRKIVDFFTDGQFLCLETFFLLTIYTLNL